MDKNLSNVAPYLTKGRQIRILDRFIYRYKVVEKCLAIIKVSFISLSHLLLS